ncbi:MAG: BON domain-containing protein [Bryobacteraceae bacterium]
MLLIERFPDMRTIVAVFLLLALWLAPAMAQQPKDDDRIYDQVRLRLVNHPDVKGGAIEVKVTDGVVTLIGKVRTDKGRQKAESLAHKVKGVKKVINEIQVTNL